MGSADIYKNFIATIKPITGFKVVGAFIDDFVTDSNSKFQNQVVVNPPILPAETQTFDGNDYTANSELLIEVYARTTKDVVQAYDLVQDKILSNKSSLIVGDIEMGTGTLATFVEGGVTIKVMTIPVTFSYGYRNG